MGINEQIVEWLKNMGNIASEQIPSFVHQAAVFGFWSNILGTIFRITFVVGGCFVMRFLIKNPPSSFQDDDRVMGYIVAIVLVGLITVFIAFTALESAQLAIKAHMAPVLYVVERFATK